MNQSSILSAAAIIGVGVLLVGAFLWLRGTPQDSQPVEGEVAGEETTAMQSQEPSAEPQPDIPSITEDVSVILHTSKGDISLLLEGKRAPKTVGNFVSLAREGFYDGTAFHRVIPDFMIQGGDPNSKDQASRAAHGLGGPGYKFEDEINANSYGLQEQRIADLLSPEDQVRIPEELKDRTLKEHYEEQGYKYRTDLDSLPMVRGTIAMANAGPNTNGSQFFIIVAPSTKNLEGKHTPFGTVTDGMDVVDAIVNVDRDEKDNPTEPVVIESVEITLSGSAE